MVDLINTQAEHEVAGFFGRQKSAQLVVSFLNIVNMEFVCLYNTWTMMRIVTVGLCPNGQVNAIVNHRPRRRKRIR